MSWMARFESGSSPFDFSMCCSWVGVGVGVMMGGGERDEGGGTSCRLSSQRWVSDDVHVSRFSLSIVSRMLFCCCCRRCGGGLFP